MHGAKPPRVMKLFTPVTAVASTVISVEPATTSHTPSPLMSATGTLLVALALRKPALIVPSPLIIRIAARGHGTISASSSRLLPLRRKTLGLLHQLPRFRAAVLSFAGDRSS